MGSTPGEAGEFSLIVAEVDPAMLEEAGESLAEAFHLDPFVAQQVVRSAPIVFARGLTRGEVKSLTPRLVHLSKMGMELRITARPTGKMPKLNWPVRPQFTAGNSGGRPLAPAFDWQDSAFVCPSCGEAFIFKRVGSLPLGAAPAEAPFDSASAPDGSPDDRYSVLLPMVADPAKADKAAELIARYRGIPVPEARELTSRDVIPIVENVSRYDAQQVLEEFKRYRLFGRMSKVQ